MRSYGTAPAYGRAGYGAGLWMRRLLIVAYFVIGLIVASSHHYLGSGHLDSLKGVIDAVLAVGLWPLVLLGVSLRV